jgi:uncharacterized protein YjbJ (UPF0337 family)
MPLDPHHRISEKRSTLSGWERNSRSLSKRNSTIGENMNTGTTDEVKGRLHEVKGKVKETVGKVTNNPDLESEGKAEHNAGKVEKKVGQIKKVFEK